MATGREIDRGDEAMGGLGQEDGLRPLATGPVGPPLTQRWPRIAAETGLAIATGFSANAIYRSLARTGRSPVALVVGLVGSTAIAAAGTALIDATLGGGTGRGLKDWALDGIRMGVISGAVGIGAGRLTKAIRSPLPQTTGLAAAGMVIGGTTVSRVSRFAPIAVTGIALGALPGCVVDQDGPQGEPWDTFDDAKGGKWSPAASITPPKPACGADKIAEVLEPARSGRETVHLDCSLQLSPGDVVTKRVLLEGSQSSGVTLDCNAAAINGGWGTVNDGQDMIDIRSQRQTDPVSGEPRWTPVRDVTVKNCKVTGSVRIQGMGPNGENPDLGASSRSYGHTTRARENAPTNITLESMYIKGTGRIPMYFSPGTNHSKLVGSTITGQSNTVAVYFDAESHQNTLDRNCIKTKTSRELVAIDGSNYNTIINNRFSSLRTGGINLYRNCGEGGTIRHTTPSNNAIINNIFQYNGEGGAIPTVILGSRNGVSGHCNEDVGYDLGSSASDHDHARYNVVAQNQIDQLPPTDMITEGNETNYGNLIVHNTMVTTAAARPAGCVVGEGENVDFILDGESTQVSESGPPQTLTCTNGKLTPSG